MEFSVSPHSTPWLGREFKSMLSPPENQDLHKRYINENGAALVISLMFIAILGMLGATAVMIVTTDMQIGSNYKSSTQAFYDAEAGVNYALGKMEEGLADGSFALPTSTDPTHSNNTSTLTYTLPTGFSFSISDITMLAQNTYSFTSTGSGPNNAECIIEVTFKREEAISFAAFGDESIVTKNSATVYSYDSRTSSPPTGPGDSTHQGHIGSNDELETKNSSYIDGDGVLGEQDDGSPTNDKIHAYADFYGDAPVNRGRIDPDPLGINSGGEYDPTTYSSSSLNDNNLATSPSYPGGNAISGNLIGLGSSYADSTMTLHGKSGGANYYITEIDLKNSTTLTIDTTSGPVRLFFDETTGTSFDMHNSSAFNVIPAGNEHKFGFFTNYTGSLDVKHGGDFDGLFYAPLADIVVHNSGDVNGAIWGKTTDIRNSGTLNFNTGLADLYASNNLTKASWNHVTN